MVLLYIWVVWRLESGDKCRGLSQLHCMEIERAVSMLSRVYIFTATPAF